MKEKQKKLFQLGLFLLAPLLFSFIYNLHFPLIFKKSIDNIYTLPLENEIFIYGEVLLNHGIIRVKKNDDWQQLLTKVKSIKKEYTLKGNNYTKKIPGDFFTQKKINLDSFFIKEKIEKYDDKQQTKPRRERRRRLRYR